MEGDDDDRWVIRTSGNLCFSAIEDGKSYFLYTYIIIRQRWRQLPRALQHWIVPQRDILFLVQGSCLTTGWWSLIILLPGSVAQLDDLSNVIKSLFGSLYWRSTPRSRRIPTCRSPPSTLPFALATPSSRPGDIPGIISNCSLVEILVFEKNDALGRHPSYHSEANFHITGHHSNLKHPFPSPAMY